MLCGVTTMLEFFFDSAEICSLTACSRKQCELELRTVKKHLIQAVSSKSLLSYSNDVPLIYNQKNSSFVDGPLLLSINAPIHPKPSTPSIMAKVQTGQLLPALNAHFTFRAFLFIHINHLRGAVILFYF